MKRRDPILPNAAIIARQEYGSRVRSRLFHVSTMLLATLAVLVAFVPFFVRVVEGRNVTTIAVVSADESLAQRSISILDSILNGQSGGAEKTFVVIRESDEALAISLVEGGALDAVLIADRRPSGQLAFAFHAGEGLGEERLQQIAVGVFGVAVLDYSANNPLAGFQLPSVDLLRASSPGGGSQPISSAEYAGRRIVGIVFVVLIFITLVIYGMWVAAGVVAEKTSRVMELMISAASPRQLVVGKVAGIGAAGVTQMLGVLIPAIVAIVIEDPLATAVLGPGPSVALSLSGLSPALLVAFLVWFALGFVLYGLIYAAAGSLVSRAEDLQMLALPLSLIAIVGYLQAVLALTGGSPGFIRFASYVPFWSPFVMLTRLAVGRVEPWEVVLSLSLLVVAIALTFVVAVRVYAAGVLLYGQRPGLRAITRAALGAK
jgi:ABC-2 type transport system permease protein